MNTDLIEKKSGLNRHWKWRLPASLLLIFLLLGLGLNSNTAKNISAIFRVYSDQSLYEKAIEIANSNQRVQEVLGKLEPIDQLAILEGNAIYSNNNNSVELSIRVKGPKGQGKMDISAVKSGTKWQYQKINIRIKTSKEAIQILKDSSQKKKISIQP